MKFKVTLKHCIDKGTQISYSINKTGLQNNA